MTCDLLAARTNRCETNETAYIVDPLESSVSYSARSNNVNLVHWPLIGELLYLVQRGGDWAGPKYQSPYCCIMIRCSAVLMWVLKG